MRHGGIFKLALVLAGVSFLIDWYVHQGLRTLLSGSDIRLRRAVLAAYWLVSITVIILLLVSISKASKPPGMTPYHQWVLSIFLTLLISKVAFILVLIFGDIYRVFAGLVNLTRKTPQDGRYIPERRKLLTQAAIV